jgi:hypothetical protein
MAARRCRGYTSGTSGRAGGCLCARCLNARKLSEAELIDGAQVGGATPLWQWIDEGATVFSYE